MLGLDSKEIEHAISRVDRHIGADKKRLADLSEERARIDTEDRIILLDISTKEVYAEILRNALLVSRGVPKDVAILRKIIIDRVRESQRKDILISRKEELEKEIPELKKKLQKLCGHPFIVGRVSCESRDGYETSLVPGCRKCVVCEFRETSTGKDRSNIPSWCEGEDKFPTLNENSERVVEKHGLGDKGVSDIWRPLEEVLAHFIDKRFYEIIKA